MAEHPSPSTRNNRALIFGSLALVVAIATALGGYILGSTLERNVADDELNDADRTLSVAQVEATNAIDALGTNEARLVAGYESTLSAIQAGAESELATRDALGTESAVTREREATEAIDAVTATVGAQQSATAAQQRTETAVARNYTATPSTPEAVVQLLSVPVRLGPGLEFPVVATLTQDTVVQILGIGPDGNWVEIGYTQDDEPTTGFVQSDAVGLIGGTLDGVAVANDFPTLSPTPTSTIVPSATITLTPSQPQAAVSAVRATVYSGPGDYFSVVGTLSFDVSVTVQGVTLDGQWLLIETDNLNGYVRADALRLTAGPSDVDVLPTLTATPEPTVLPVVSPTLTVTPSTPEALAAGQFVVVRAGPSELFDVLGIVSSTEPLEIVGISRDGVWFRVVYSGAPGGFGWVSGQVVRIAGNISGVPVVDGPPLPTPVANDVPTGSGSQSSAGATNTTLTLPLPEIAPIDYTQLAVTAYSYELAVAINGNRDNQVYETFFTFGYVEDTATDNASVTIDASGRLLTIFTNEGELDFLSDLVPLTIGIEGGQSYFYSAADGSCMALGTDVTRQSLIDIFTGPASVLSDLSILDRLPDNAVFGDVDDGGLVGLGGHHYQLLGVEENGEIVPLDDFKVDLWYSEDDSVLYGYRVTINITPETYFTFRDFLISIDSQFENVSVFDGSVTLYLLPRAIDEVAVEQALAPAACDDVIP